MSQTARSTRYDVVVVGAGPAGSHLALRLARAGRSVALLDRKRFPRGKPCGEFMSPECIPLLGELGLREAVLERGARRVQGMRLHGHDAVAEGRFVAVGGTEAPFDHGYALRREVLDQISFDAARAHPDVAVHEGWSMVGLLRDPRGCVLGVDALDPERRPVRVLGRFTVGADGLRSRVARELGVQRPLPWLDKFAVVARFDGLPAEDHAEVHFFADGYLAGAPVDAGLFTLNMVVDRAALPTGGRQRIEAALLERIAATPFLGERLGGRAPVGPVVGCGPLAGRTTRQVVDGAALVGDACGYVDPVTGEGLYFAMRGAALLAVEIDRALAAGRTDAAALRGYLRARRREFAPRYAIARLLQRGLRHPRLVRSVLRLLEARPRMADLLVATTGDYVDPRQLLRPSVWIDALRRAPRPLAG